MQRERLSSRLGFLLISAGCAIGLGNVWRFPYIVGKYGGAAFVLIYLFFLVVMGLPIMVMEFSVGRASQCSAAKSFDVLQKKGGIWHLTKIIAILGNYLLMMFYTTVGGWMINYVFKMACGQLSGMGAEEISNVFSAMLQSPFEQVLFMVVMTGIGFLICSKGLQNGVEKMSKIMMVCLLCLMGVLAVRSLMLPGASEGLKFYLMPDFSKMMSYDLNEVIFAAMGQSFFTLSLGIGALAIFGSYIDKERSLTSESISILVLDTLVALISGIIIFPACFSFGVDAGSGPGLVFITLPIIFEQMPLGRLWGVLFFIFLSFAALTTVIAVFENIISFWMDHGFERKKAVHINLVLILVLSLPCALGFNVLDFIQPFGAGTTIQDLEDFIISNVLLPVGSIGYLLFCTRECGWGWNSFLEEANAGKGLKFPKRLRFYVAWILPAVVFYVLVQGFSSRFAAPYDLILSVLSVGALLLLPLVSTMRQNKMKRLG